MEFFPQINNDINDFVSIISETGIIEIPLICETKKCLIECDIPKQLFEQEKYTLNFGEIPMGQSKLLSFRLINSGAIKTKVSLSFEQNSKLFNISKNSAFQIIDGYSTETISIVFNSEIIGSCSDILLLHFDNLSVDNINIKLLVLFVIGLITFSGNWLGCSSFY